MSQAFQILGEPETAGSRRVRESSLRGRFLREFCYWCWLFQGFIPVLIVLLFFGSLFWAKRNDPFSRKWFSLRAPDGASFQCVAVLPKPIQRRPVVIYAHGAGGELMADGNDLRQIAGLGLGVVSFEYDQGNEAKFAGQMESLLQHLGRQAWADTNLIAWVGFSLGANRMLDFALSRPERQPNLLVYISGTLVQPVTAGFGNMRLPLEGGVPKLRSALVVRGERDGIFRVEDGLRLVGMLQSNGIPVDMQVLPGLTQTLEPDRGVVFRWIGEYCLTHLTGAATWQNYHSIAQWDAEAPAYWLFSLPVAAWVGWGFARWRRARPEAMDLVPLKRSEIALRWVAGIMAISVLAESTFHVVPAHLPISNKSLALARRFSVRPRELADFEFLAARPIWSGVKLKVLLEHVELAIYNREIINWRLDDDVYRDYVLCPVITGRPGEALNWRRTLWEEFYPRIRHENSPADAAVIVVRHLRERVTVATMHNPPRDVGSIWLRQITDETGFQIIYVAALRSVGVPARLNFDGQTEFWDGHNWSSAPRPVIGLLCLSVSRPPALSDVADEGFRRHFRKIDNP